MYMHSHTQARFKKVIYWFKDNQNGIFTLKNKHSNVNRLEYFGSKRHLIFQRLF